MKNGSALSAAPLCERATQSPVCRQVDPFAQRLIRQKARQLVGKYGFTASDREDLEQDLWLKLLERLQAEGEQVANREAFIATLVNRQVSDLIRHRRAGKRNAKRLRSLDWLVKDGDGCWVPLAEEVPVGQALARLGLTLAERPDQAELAALVAAVMTQLPADMRDLCERLQHSSVSAVARQMGLPRRTLRDLIGQLRQRLATTGLADFVKNRPPVEREITSEEPIDG